MDKILSSGTDIVTQNLHPFYTIEESTWVKSEQSDTVTRQFLSSDQVTNWFFAISKKWPIYFLSFVDVTKSSFKYWGVTKCFYKKWRVTKNSIKIWPKTLLNNTLIFSTECLKMHQRAVFFQKISGGACPDPPSKASTSGASGPYGTRHSRRWREYKSHLTQTLPLSAS